jgi:spore coat polysaccharide biosynthesis predicted glycosyltransferase SpsG
MTTRRPARVLFQSHNRKGMGHLVRGLNIAREITALDETADIHFYTKAAPPEVH